jgi:hypothetical protein
MCHENGRASERGNWGKTFFVMSAVALALWGLFLGLDSPTQRLWRFGRPERMPPSVTVVIATSEDGSRSMANAVLVDADYGLYLTVDHAIDRGRTVASIRVPNGRFDSVVGAWRDGPAELMVVSIAHPRWVKEVPTMPIAPGPPVAGQLLFVTAYHYLYPGISLDPVVGLRGYKRRFRVLLPADDYCTIRSIQHDCLFIHMRRAVGLPITLEEAQAIYPYYIFVSYEERHHLYGLVRGMSGGPAMDEEGRIVGISTAILDKMGRQSALAPAYKAFRLIEQARKDITAGKAKGGS